MLTPSQAKDVLAALDALGLNDALGSAPSDHFQFHAGNVAHHGQAVTQTTEGNLS